MTTMPWSGGITSPPAATSPATSPSLEAIIADITRIANAANTMAANIPLLHAAPDVIKNLQMVAPQLATAAANLESLVQAAQPLFQLLVALGIKLPIPLP